MDLELDDAQRAVRDMAREFAAHEVRPWAKEIDRTSEFPWKTLKKMWPLGLMGMTAPEEYGGNGNDNLSYILALEEISRACASTGVIMAVHNSVSLYPIYKFGTPEQRERFMRPMAREGKLGAFALTEANAGSDISDLATTAVRDGNHYVINGSKMFITSGKEADVIVVVARTDPDAGTHGFSTFLVEKGMEGLGYGKIERKMGVKPTSTTELTFDNLVVPAENMLGKPGEGFKIALVSLDGGRVGIAAQALGIAEEALEEAVEYAKIREQFGRPIGSFQGISFMLAEMATKIEAARWLVYNAASKKDLGVRYTREASMAKFFASRVAKEVTMDAVQVFGGIGYTNETIMERLMRDARITEIYEGTSEIQLLVISKSLLR